MSSTEALDPITDAAAPEYELTAVVVPLLKSVLYRDENVALWAALLGLQARVRDYVAVLGLDLTLDEAEGYAFLRGRRSNSTSTEPDDDAPKLPRLIARRPLGFQVSLLLALLRKKLAEFDASGSDTRLILSRDQVVELIRVFLPAGSNESRLIDQVETHVNKVIELGFVRRLKPQGSGALAARSEPMFEVRRILKAFVDAQWLSEFDLRLAAYQAQLKNPDGACTAPENADE